MGNVFSGAEKRPRDDSDDEAPAKRQRIIEKPAKKLFIMRGPPGVGKTTYALQKLAEELNISPDDLNKPSDAVRLGHIMSTDDFFTWKDVQGNQYYDFAREKLTLYHRQNSQRSNAAMSLGLSPLFIDNTNMALWEMRVYVEQAVRHGYDVKIVEPWEVDSRWSDPEFLRERNEGGMKQISAAIIARMLENYQKFTSIDDVLHAKMAERRTDIPLYIGYSFGTAPFVEDLLLQELPSMFENTIPWDTSNDMWSELTGSGFFFPDNWHASLKFFGRAQTLSEQNETYLRTARDAKGSFATFAMTHLVMVEDCYIAIALKPLGALPVADSETLHITVMMKPARPPRFMNNVIADLNKLIALEAENKMSESGDREMKSDMDEVEVVEEEESDELEVVKNEAAWKASIKSEINIEQEPQAENSDPISTTTENTASRKDSLDGMKPFQFNTHLFDKDVNVKVLELPADTKVEGCLEFFCAQGVSTGCRF